LGSEWSCEVVVVVVQTGEAEKSRAPAADLELEAGPHAKNTSSTTSTTGGNGNGQGGVALRGSPNGWVQSINRSINVNQWFVLNVLEGKLNNIGIQTGTATE
jgi:hypothetical protein